MVKFSDKITYFYFSLLLVAIVALHWFGWLAPIENGVRRLFTGALIKVSVSRAKGTQPLLINEAASSTPSRAELSAKIKLLTSENDELRHELNFKKKTAVILLPANVIGREGSAFGQVIIINRGKSDGLELKQPVIAGEGILIGTIIKTESDIAYVLLLNDNQSKVAATVLNRDKSVGVVEGGYGISLRLTLIPRNETIAVGDEIVTSGLDEATPRGLLIGIVAEVENEAYKPFQQAVLTPAIDLNKLTVVSAVAGE